MFAGRSRSQGQNLFYPREKKIFQHRGQKRRHTRNVKMTNNVFVKRSFEYTKLVRSLLKHTGNRKAFRWKPKSAGTTVCFVRGLQDQTGPCSVRYDPYGSPERKDGPPLFSGEHRPILSAGVAFFLPGRLPSSYPDASELVKSRAARLFLFSCPRPWF